MMFCFPTSPI